MSGDGYKAALLSSCTAAGCLTFGTYTLKSGRISPYFFNAGRLHSATLLRSLSTAFAHTIASYSPSLDFDVLFGPAYKGIPLAAVVTEKLATVDESRFGNISYSFNRKEKKAYGDGGSIVGADLKGKRVIIVDDVMTAGTAVREAVDIIEHEGGSLVGIVVVLDRMEKMPPQAGQDPDAPAKSAIGEVRSRYNVPVLAVLTLQDIMQSLKAVGNEDDFKRMDEYRAKYQPVD
jgi:orotate phosphoribosyltransferase